MARYFAYGSNMDPERMRKRIGRQANVHPACLPGHVLRFSKRSKHDSRRGYANIELDVDSDVYGILFDITEVEMLMLDTREGAAIGHYRRKTVEVEAEMGTRVTAIAYVARAEWVAEDLLPTRKYLKHLLAGRDFLPEDYVEWLEQQWVLEE